MVEISDRSWSDVKNSDYEDDVEYCRACLINSNKGPRSKWDKDHCALLVIEPAKMGGKYNRDAIKKAANDLIKDGDKLPGDTEQKRAAANTLMYLFSEMDEQPPAGLVKLTDT